uniref:YcgJ family protein n=1 Tax=Cyanobium sp. TaxID=2164130 RepID=UPI004049B1A7
MNDSSLSNYSTCDLNARSCWSKGWERKQVNVPLSNQLFGSENGLALAVPAPNNGNSFGQLLNNLMGP